MRIIFEDCDLLVVEKPAGVVVHPAYRHPDGTFWDALVPLFRDRGILDGPHLLHRLDRDTSGLLCIPKQAPAHRALARALQSGRFVKGYLALVHGRLPDEGVVDAPLARDPADRRLVCVDPQGKAARTRFRVLRRFAQFTLVRVHIDTGRTHQIRVHLASRGCPIAGDVVYGAQPPACERLFLHADSLAFPHPRGTGQIACRAPLPCDLRLALVRVGTQQHAVPSHSNPHGPPPRSTE